MANVLVHGIARVVGPFVLPVLRPLVGQILADQQEALYAPLIDAPLHNAPPPPVGAPQVDARQVDARQVDAHQVDLPQDLSHRPLSANNVGNDALAAEDPPERPLEDAPTGSGEGSLELDMKVQQVVNERVEDVVNARVESVVAARLAGAPSPIEQQRMTNLLLCFVIIFLVPPPPSGNLPPDTSRLVRTFVDAVSESMVLHKWTEDELKDKVAKVYPRFGMTNLAPFEIKHLEELVRDNLRELEKHDDEKWALKCCRLSLVILFFEAFRQMLNLPVLGIVNFEPLGPVLLSVWCSLTLVATHTLELNPWSGEKLDRRWRPYFLGLRVSLCIYGAALFGWWTYFRTQHT
ncbi:hypothetical protein MNV49_003222 [Pseudohyphozyma bogoriensis]|nr:hypothetical protein MNV49_003222 [Pseudohyphozyma bogoriensis]